MSTGALTELLADDEKPGMSRYSRYVAKVNEFFGWPAQAAMLPLSPDAEEIQYLLEGLADADRELLRQIRDMGRDEQRALAEMITRLRGAPDKT
jgi:hypothetical protein